MYDDAPAYLQDFLNYMSVIKARSPLTVKNYYFDLKLFLRYLKLSAKLVDKNTPFREIPIDDVSEEMVKTVNMLKLLEFLSFMAEENDRAARSRKSVSLRQFFKYLTETKNWFSTSPAQNLSLPSAKRALPKHLTIEQATELLDEAGKGNDWKDVRNYCIITFFVNCGMRLSELAGINIDHYITTKDYTTDEVIHYVKVLGKGSKERIVYLNAACVDAYEQWIRVRPPVKTTSALFVSGQGKRLSNRRIQQVVDEELAKSGLGGQGFSVHKLRHTAATLMYQNGVDIRVLKEVLGHESINTTEIYTHVADKQVQQAVNHNPLANATKRKKGGNDDKKAAEE